MTTIFNPPIIKNLVGKEVTFKIEITKDNVALKSNIFTATDAYDDYVSSTSSCSTSMADCTDAFSTDVRIISYSLHKH